MPVVSTRAMMVEPRRAMMLEPRPTRPQPTRRPVLYSGPVSCDPEDEFGGLWGAIKKAASSVKKAVSIKSAVKVVKKAAPVALAVATGGASAGIAAAVTAAASALKPKQQEIVEEAAAAYQTGGGTNLLAHSLQLAQERLALQPAAYSTVPSGTQLYPQASASNLAAIPQLGPVSANNVPTMRARPVAERQRRTDRAPVSSPIGGLPQGALIAGAAVLAVVLLARRK